MARLSHEFEGTFAHETVDRFVRESAERWDGNAEGHGYVAGFIERFARQRLEDLGRVEGWLMKTKPQVLFVCVHNAGRSQMAAALLDHHAAGRIDVRSAGTTPAEEIHAGVVEAMGELGIDLSREFPKPLMDEAVRAADIVITMGCGDACPIYPGKRYLDWDLDDPAGKPVEEVRAIRDDIDRRVRELASDLLAETRSGRA